MATADEKYRKALQLYMDTEMTITEISRECGVTRSGFAAYINRCHRDLMYARHGIKTDDPGHKMKRNNGQNPRTRNKYREAIEACDSEEYIHLNVSQIARMFNLNGTALGNQLKTHYPDIIERREKERQKRGIADNFQRGPRKYAVEAYSEAVELLRTSDMTIEEVAETCKVSFTGFRQHVLLYHKDLVDFRRNKRMEGKIRPKLGRVSGNGTIRCPREQYAGRFDEALSLYGTTSLSIKEICKMTGTDIPAFRNHLRMWHKKLIFKRRGVELPETMSDREKLDGIKRSNPWTAEKYAPAIEELASGAGSVEGIARKYGFVPEVFREYLKKHHNRLWQNMGMVEMPGGKKVLRRSYEKYAQAIKAYATTTESLKSIASRMGIAYNSIGGFIRRNMPEVIQSHNSLLCMGS